MVINYDVPHDAEDYVHRIGRTARADRDGVAITLVNEDDMFAFHQIEKFLDKDIKKNPLPEGCGEGPEYTTSKRPGRSSAKSRRRKDRDQTSHKDAKQRGDRRQRNEIRAIKISRSKDNRSKDNRNKDSPSKTSSGRTSSGKHSRIRRSLSRSADSVEKVRSRSASMRNSRRRHPMRGRRHVDAISMPTNSVGSRLSRPRRRIIRPVVKARRKA